MKNLCTITCTPYFKPRELLVRLQLQLRLGALLLVLGELHRVLTLGLLRLDQRGLQEREVRALRLHELRVGLKE